MVSYVHFAQAMSIKYNCKYYFLLCIVLSLCTYICYFIVTRMNLHQSTSVFLQIMHYNYVLCWQITDDQDRGVGKLRKYLLSIQV